MQKTLVSLFAGCGGLDLGFSFAEFKLLWANDFCKNAVVTYKKNIGDHIVLGDITKIPSTEIPDSFDVLVGGFPCQGFSVANTKRNMQDQRNFLYKELLRVIADKKPKVFLAENVKGLLSMEGGKVFEMILNDFSLLGYNVSYRVLKASDFGVPQNRERVIIMGNRIGVENLFPIATHSNPKEIEKGQDALLPHVAVKDVIGFLADQRVRVESFQLEDGQMVYNHTARTNVADSFWDRKYDVSQKEICAYLREWKKKAGISANEIDKRLGYLHTAPHWFRMDSSGSIPTTQDWVELKKMIGFDDTYDEKVLTLVEKNIVFEQTLRISNWDTPSDTITASGPEIHPNKQRRLSVRECAMLQTFPMDFVFEGSLTSMYRQIGNAVPCKLAYQLGLCIREMLA